MVMSEASVCLNFKFMKLCHLDWFSAQSLSSILWQRKDHTSWAVWLKHPAWLMIYCTLVQNTDQSNSSLGNTLNLSKPLEPRECFVKVVCPLWGKDDSHFQYVVLWDYYGEDNCKWLCSCRYIHVGFFLFNLLELFFLGLSFQILFRISTSCGYVWVIFGWCLWW